MTPSQPLSRRDLLRGRIAGRRPGVNAVFRPEPGPEGDVLVCLFLRGGMDGLHVVPPHGDRHYARHRPTLALLPPDARGAKTLDLDGFFALHPNLAPLMEPYRAGELAIVHACGTPDRTRSHFEAMATMECGIDDGSLGESGWLGRHLAISGTKRRTALRALALGDMVPQSLHGAMGAVAVSSLSEFRLKTPERWGPAFRTALTALYAPGADPVSEGGRDTLNLLRSMERLDPKEYRPVAGARYPDGDFGSHLRQVAQLIKADVGLEVACVDLGGWDSHVAQGPLLDGLTRDLGQGLAALRTDLGDRFRRVTVLAMSEFGRRAYENSGVGTDHGRATCMFVMGGGIHGGRVFARWPGLAPDHLEEPGDLRVTTDYRDVLAEIVRDRLGNPELARVFPGRALTPCGVTG